MKTDNATSASTSAKTSAVDEQAIKDDPQAAPNESRPQPLHPEASEADYLTLQQEHAKAAIGQVISEIKNALASGADPRVLAKQYPWATLGVSAVAGFVAASMLVPSKEEQALKKLAAIERALNPQPPRRPDPADEAMNVDGGAAKQKYKAGRSGMMSAILGEVIGAVKPALVSLLTAGVTAKASQPSQEDMAAAQQGQGQGGAGGMDAA